MFTKKKTSQSYFRHWARSIMPTALGQGKRSNQQSSEGRPSTVARCLMLNTLLHETVLR